MIRTFGKNCGAGVRGPDGILARHQFNSFSTGWRNEVDHKFVAALRSEKDPSAVRRPVRLGGIWNSGCSQPLLAATRGGNSVERRHSALSRDITNGPIIRRPAGAGLPLASKGELFEITPANVTHVEIWNSI